MEPGSDHLPLAVRAWARPTPATENNAPGTRKRTRKRKRSRVPEYALVFDTETTTDAAQQLNFGCWRYCRRITDPSGESRLVCVQEGLFYADDLPERDRAGHRVLTEYVESDRHRPTDVDLEVPDADRYLRLRSLSEFLEDRLWTVLYKIRGLIVCFNTPFDISRLAWRVGTTTWHHRRKHNNEGSVSDQTPDKRRRNRFAGGFSFTLWRYLAAGGPAENRYRPRVVIKSLDSKRALKGLGSPAFVDEEDLVPDDDPDGEPDEEYRFHGHLLDLRTLAFALTDKGHSLESACDIFDVPYTKRDVTHGRIDPDYVTYCREDTHATQRLCDATVREFLRHPVDLPATAAFSPATIGRAYLEKMRVAPVLERQPDFDLKVLGWSMAAYYGGRAEARVRRVPVPVVYCDFLSMYPTVCSLVGIWGLLTADKIDADTDATDQVQQFLDSITLDDCFDPATWDQLRGIACIQPDGDIVPVRAAYQGREFQIGINPLRSAETMWYPIADLVAAKLLSHNATAPTVLGALQHELERDRSGRAPVELVDPGRFARVAGPTGLDTPDALSRRIDSPVAPELLRLA